MLRDQVVWRLVSWLLSRLAAKTGLLPEAPATDSPPPRNLQRVLVSQQTPSSISPAQRRSFVGASHPSAGCGGASDFLSQSMLIKCDESGKAFPLRPQLAAGLEGLGRVKGAATPFARPRPELEKHKNKTKRKKESVARLMARADPLEEGALRRHLDEGFEALAYCMVYRFGR